MKHISLIITFLSVLLVYFPTICYSQNLTIYKCEGEKLAWAEYHGNTKWLLDQKDPNFPLLKMKEINSISIEVDKITTEEMQYLSKIKNMECFEFGITRLEGVKFDDEAFKILTESKHIIELCMCKKELKNSDFALISKLDQLEWLNISNQIYKERDYDIPVEVLPQIEKLTKLKGLELNHQSTFTNDSLLKLSKTLTKLTNLKIYSDKFTDEALDIISKNMKLEVLHISSDKISKKAAEEFIEKNQEYWCISINEKYYRNLNANTKREPKKVIQLYPEIIKEKE